MNQQLKSHILVLIVFSVLLSFATVVMAEAKTDITIKNYREQNVVVQIKQVKLNGEIEWVGIGSVGGKRARTFHDVTIGSVLRVTPEGSNESLKEFRVQTSKTDYTLE